MKRGSVPQSAKDKVLNAAVAFCSTDIRPFTAIGGKGFEQLANTSIEVGAKHGGLVDAKSAVAYLYCKVAPMAKCKYAPFLII